MSDKGCCSSCQGIGYTAYELCWDCQGTGCAHPPPLCEITPFKTYTKQDYMKARLNDVEANRLLHAIFPDRYPKPRADKESEAWE